MDFLMYFGRLPTAKAGLLVVAGVVLSIAGACGLTVPQRAVGASALASAHEVKCTTGARGHKFGATREPMRRSGQRSCRSTRTGRPNRPSPIPIQKDAELIPAISETARNPIIAPDGSESPIEVELPESGKPPAIEEGVPFRFFSSSSFWNAPVAADAPLDPQSAEIVGAFIAEITRQQKAEKGPWINTVSYSVPIYTVPADQPTVSVALTASAASTLRSAWQEVPLPSNAHPAAGSDSTLVVWQPSTDSLWEFWRLANDTEGWHASWGGAMQDASSNPGVYDQKAWPGATRWWGSSASSMSIAGGLITIEDLERGQINHALAISTPSVRSGIYSSPAQRSDGTSTNPLSLPEGAHLRLDPNLDLATLHLPPLTRMMAEAAQRYGIFVRDRAPSVTAFYAQDPIPTGGNPYLGPSGYFGGQSPLRLLETFPWSHLQLMKMELHSLS